MNPDDLAFEVASRMRRLEAAILGGGIVLEAARAGYAKISLLAAPDMLNGHGSVHGGVIFTLADTAFAYACNSSNELAVASQASIAFLTPGREGEVLTAEAVEQAVAGRSGAYVVTVTGAEGRVVAVFQGLSRRIGGKVIEEA